MFRQDDVIVEIDEADREVLVVEIDAIAAALEPYGVTVTAYEQELAGAMGGLREPDRNIR